jgi:hypothetical protein
MSLWLLELRQNTDAASLAAFAAPLHHPTSSEMNDTWPIDSLHDYQSLLCIGSLHRVPLHVTVAGRTVAEHKCCQSGYFCCPIAPPHKLRNERHLANRLTTCPLIIDAYWEPSSSPSSFMSLWLLELWQNTDAASLAAFAAPLHHPTSSQMNDTWPIDSMHDY